MTERPILFSGPMVRAILAGQKTITRRVVKPQPSRRLVRGRQERPGGACKWYDADGIGPGVEVRCPYGADRDRLWVKETHAIVPRSAYWHYHEWAIYREGWEGVAPRWRPSIYLPRWASRITLEITGVAVERLQAITEEQARAEGVADREAYRRLWDKINGAGAWDANPFVWAVSFRRVTQ